MEIVSADQVNYQQKTYSHPSYKFEPQFPNTFGQKISLNTSQIPVTISIPPEVFNLAESYLSYDVTLPGVPTNNIRIWHALQGLCEISHIQFYSGSNQWIADVDNLQNYLDIVIKREISADDFMSLDPSLTNIGVSNAAINAVPALRNSNMTNANVTRNAYSASRNFTEPGYFAVGPAGSEAVPANGAVKYSVKFPLGLIKNTIFSLDKSLYFGQTMYMKLYFGPISKICYQSDVDNNPSGGNKAAYTGAGVIENLQIMLAVESNQDFRTQLMSKVHICTSIQKY